MEEVIVEGRNFRLLQDSELPEIIEFIAQFLPDSIKFHQTMKTYLNDHVWDFHFYITKTWPEPAIILHFPGMTRTPNGRLYESFSVFCPCDQIDHLVLLKDEDVLIDWTQPIYLNFTHIMIMNKIEEFYHEIGTIEKQHGDIYVQHEHYDDDCNIDYIDTVIFTDDAELLQLTPDNAKQIHDLYPANHMECCEIFEKLIKKLPCYGVFSVNGELAAWMVQSYYGAMFSMQTKPDYRRKGYGLILAKYLSKIVKERGYLPFVVIRPENDASKALYTKLGFKKHFQTVRAILRPYHTSNDDDDDDDGQGGGGGETNQ